jgi:hypothetical protein
MNGAGGVEQADIMRRALALTAADKTQRSGSGQALHRRQDWPYNKT